MVICKNAIRLGEQKNMNLPGAIVDLPTLTPQDEDDLVEFGLKQGVDIIAASFVRKASDVENIRDVLGPKGAHIKIISKIENHEDFIIMMRFLQLLMVSWLPEEILVWRSHQRKFSSLKNG